MLQVVQGTGMGPQEHINCYTSPDFFMSDGPMKSIASIKERGQENEKGTRKRIMDNHQGYRAMNENCRRCPTGGQGDPL